MTTKITGHFFYSKGQRAVKFGLGRNPRVNFCKINREIKEYTEMNSVRNKPVGKWDDYVYLGSGEYSHNNSENAGLTRNPQPRRKDEN